MQSLLKESQSQQDFNDVGEPLFVMNPVPRNAHPEVEDDIKMLMIENHFREIMKILGLDLQDDSLKDTPRRVAKMYVKEIFSGLSEVNRPSISLFENQFAYKEMLVEKNITVNSFCEHHFLPITGRAHVAYYSKGKVIGLSKLNRIVSYCSSRPQVQEKLTIQIAEMIKEAVGSEDVAVVIDAVHHCVTSRGIRDGNSSTITSEFSGRFLNSVVKGDFLKYVGL